MRSFRSFSARPLGLAAAAALAVGLTSVGPALVAPASAAENVGSAFIANNTLTIVGTNAPDVVTLAGDAAEARVTFGADPGNVHHFSLGDFTSVAVFLGNGDDLFTEPSGVLSSRTVAVSGGNGNDRITTGDAVDLIVGGNGNDSVDAGRGNDNVLLGNGDDFFVWNPGQGSDAANGGNGNDVMQFNGNDMSEIMSLSANGSQAVFLRNLGTIRMDLTDIEIFNLRALGGVDSVTINDLEGTSIRHANIDLSGANGGGDQAADAVTVNGTNQADRIDVTAPGGQIGVTGLQADTQIAGAETQDHLQVNTLDGNDKVNLDPGVSPILGVAVDLGLGQL
jgi:Ca2+-binding RTX toxin-like protein